MAHYAQVNSDKIVVQVLVMDNDMETNDGEQACIDWLQANVHADDWVKTSYNNNISKFIAPQPFASWSLDSDDDWQAPVAQPDDDKRYVWDEDVYQADNSKGWVEVE